MNVGGSHSNSLIDDHLIHIGDIKTFFVLTAKKPDDLRRYSSQVGLSEHDGVSLNSAQRHRYSLFLWCFLLCVDHSHTSCLSVPTPSWALLWSPAQVNDNLNPSGVNFPSSCSSLVLVTRTADVYVCGFTVGTTFSPEMIQTAQNLPAGTSSWVKVM